MTIARVFKSGNSQAVRLPRQFRVTSTTLEIFRRGDELVLREPGRGLAHAFDALAALPEDFMAGGREDDAPQPREELE